MGLIMIRSMTGFGSSKAKIKYSVITVEIKTVNHKFLEISCKLPNSLSLFEDKVKALLQKGIRRGKVYFNLMHEGLSPQRDDLYLDVSLAKNYYKKLTELKKIFSIEENIGLKDVISYPGVLNHKVTEKEVSKLWPQMQRAINKALCKLVLEREKEGKHLSQDLKRRLIKIKKHVARIKERSYVNVKRYKHKLEKRIKDISGILPTNNDRLIMEVALYAKNSDISEEITRLGGHILNLYRIVQKGGETGKKLDFVAQEMHREANTIGSKSSDYTISRCVIEIKSEIEKIREQVKNIE